MEVGDPADDRRAVDDVRGACDGRAGDGGLTQVAGVDLGGLADPARGLALVGDADLEVGVAHERAHDRLTDHARAAGDEHAAHAAAISET